MKTMDGILVLDMDKDDMPFYLLLTAQEIEVDGDSRIVIAKFACAEAIEIEEHGEEDTIIE